MSYYLSQLEGTERACACARNDAAMQTGRRIVPEDADDEQPSLPDRATESPVNAQEDVE